MNSKSRGFTFLEIIVVVAIMALLAAFVIPSVKQHVEASRAARILSIYDTIKVSCSRFRIDTSLFVPNEDSGTPAAPLTDKDNHQLSMAQTTIPGWDGPYLDHVLSLSDSPYGNQIGIRPVRVGVANQIWLYVYGPSQTVAQLVDNKLDLQDGSGNWNSTGTVWYDATPGSECLMIFLSREN